MITPTTAALIAALTDNNGSAVKNDIDTATALAIILVWSVVFVLTIVLLERNDH